jgi:hypothetical protein
MVKFLMWKSHLEICGAHKIRSFIERAIKNFQKNQKIFLEIFSLRNFSEKSAIKNPCASVLTQG